MTAADQRQPRYFTCRLWWIVPLVICIVAIVICTNFILVGFLGKTTELASINFGDGYTIRIWEKIVGIAEPNWDPDHGLPEIYYEMSRLDSVIIPTTFIGLNFGDPYDIRVAFAEEGKLVSVYDANNWNSGGIFLMLDVTNPETFIYSSRMALGEWQQIRVDMIDRLRQENPDLPFCRNC